MSDKAPKILLVEDDVGLQKQIKWSLDEYEVLATGDRETALTQLRRFEPAVEIHRGEDRFERVRQQRGPRATARALFALSEAKRGADVRARGDLGERRLVDHSAAQAREHAL